MELPVSFSPCPNDTFIFDALINKKIDTEGITFTPKLEDVEALNRNAFETKYPITKLSFPAYFSNMDKYVLLDAGAALGKGVGPLLVTKHAIDTITPRHTIALPGRNTTANLLFTFAYPGEHKKRFMIFSAIENAVVNEETDLGVIIHENRFTYMKRGLTKVSDLGEVWEQKKQLPIPLGGFAIARNLDTSLIKKVGSLIRKSLEYAFDHYPEIPPFVREHSQSMSEDVMRQHIDLYVNDHTLSLGEDGKVAIRELYKVYLQIVHPGNEPDESQLFL